MTSIQGRRKKSIPKKKWMKKRRENMTVAVRLNGHELGLARKKGDTEYDSKTKLERQRDGYNPAEALFLERTCPPKRGG